MHKRIFALALITVAALVMLSGCVINTGGGNPVRGRGSMESHTIYVTGFTGLDINGGYELTFRQSPNYSITMVIQGNLFEYVDATVSGGVLYLSNSRNIRTTGGNTPRLYIYAPELDSINIRGAVDGDIELNTSNLNIEVSGAATLNLSGSVDMLNISSAGAASVNAFGMTATDSTISMTGAGTIDVYATSTLDVRISGVGSVTYDGNPQVTRNVTGIGVVQSRN